ncbi:hypothetical protein HELRODRAFT_189494 [Helobdella robusta]|uniref:RING-type domain-containing protein n=1 Tax=Helobdella robusta TaxID=6412 RepID=T1FR36_HELRO|nr:hypothetical protein HELRODRAFT_189494 [Helobdella robusta]ESN94715.1 hypothetical protein HELRODRAFT_189494 [Helobdella robusta]
MNSSLAASLREESFLNVLKNLSERHGIKLGGFPEELFLQLSSQETETLSCNICFSIVNDCCQCLNAHKFCRSCIFTWSLSCLTNSDKCPVCRCVQDDYKPVEDVNKILFSKLVRCPIDACSEETTLELFLQHEHGRSMYSNVHVDFAKVKQENVMSLRNVILSQIDSIVTSTLPESLGLPNDADRFHMALIEIMDSMMQLDSRITNIMSNTELASTLFYENVNNLIAMPATVSSTDMAPGNLHGEQSTRLPHHAILSSSSDWMDDALDEFLPLGSTRSQGSVSNISTSHVSFSHTSTQHIPSSPIPTSSFSSLNDYSPDSSFLMSSSAPASYVEDYSAPMDHRSETSQPNRSLSSDTLWDDNCLQQDNLMLATLSTLLTSISNNNNLIDSIQLPRDIPYFYSRPNRTGNMEIDQRNIDLISSHTLMTPSITASRPGQQMVFEGRVASSSRPDYEDDYVGAVCSGVNDELYDGYSLMSGRYVSAGDSRIVLSDASNGQACGPVFHDLKVIGKSKNGKLNRAYDEDDNDDEAAAIEDDKTLYESSFHMLSPPSSSSLLIIRQSPPASYSSSNNSRNKSVTYKFDAKLIAKSPNRDTANAVTYRFDCDEPVFAPNERTFALDSASSNMVDNYKTRYNGKEGRYFKLRNVFTDNKSGEDDDVDFVKCTVQPPQGKRFADCFLNNDRYSVTKKNISNCSNLPSSSCYTGSSLNNILSGKQSVAGRASNVMDASSTGSSKKQFCNSKDNNAGCSNRSTGSSATHKSSYKLLNCFPRLNVVSKSSQASKFSSHAIANIPEDEYFDDARSRNVKPPITSSNLNKQILTGNKKFGDETKFSNNNRQQLSINAHNLESWLPDDTAETTGNENLLQTTADHLDRRDSSNLSKNNKTSSRSDRINESAADRNISEPVSKFQRRKEYAKNWSLLCKKKNPKK